MSFLTPFTQNQTLPIIGSDHELEISPICALYSELSSLEMSVTSLTELSTIEWDTAGNSAVRAVVLFLDNKDELAAANMSNYSCLASSIWGEKIVSFTLHLIKATEGKVLFLNCFGR